MRASRFAATTVSSLALLGFGLATPASAAPDNVPVSTAVPQHHRVLVADVEGHQVSCKNRYPSFSVTTGKRSVRLYYWSDDLGVGDRTWQHRYTTKRYTLDEPMLARETVSVRIKAVDSRGGVTRATIWWTLGKCYKKHWDDHDDYGHHHDDDDDDDYGRGDDED
jgi:hypothetical protein